jgi:octaprenyl-diphosphate synthase
MSQQDINALSSLVMKQQFHDLIANLSADLKTIDEIILSFAQGKSPLIQEVSHHLIASGGKRIRPILLILAAKMCGTKSGNDHHNLAAAVELIHSATLLHDDVVDTSEVRRGKKTANAIWDNKASILVGDYLFSVSFQLMVLTKNLATLDLLAKASSIMADGEVMQLQNSNDIALTQEKYLEIIFGKTAVLFSAACEVGALINNRPDHEIKALREFGANLGVIFQIVDDMLDYNSKEEVLGKDLGNDFFEGKVTLPIIFTYQKADESDKKLIKDLFEKNFMTPNKNQDDFQKILALIEKYKGLEASKNMALQQQELAIKNLEIFPDSQAKQDLILILKYSSARIF